MADEIYEVLCGILKDLLITCDPSLDTPLLGTGGVMDSLTAAQFIACVEEEFRTDITGQDLDLKCMESVRTLVEFLQ